MSTDKRIIDMTAADLFHLVTTANKKELEPLYKRIEALEQALALQAPSFDPKTACIYIGRSPSYLANAHSNYGLPKVKVGTGNRVLRAHLDHFLTGGTFTASGQPITKTPPKQSI